MTTFFEPVAETAEWRPDTQHRPDAQPGPEEPTPAGGVVPAMKALARNRRAALLSRVVETEILPRLAVARGAARSKSTGDSVGFVATEADTAELVQLLLLREAAAAVAFLEVLQMRGAMPASLYLGIITQAARRLGELWEDDRADFAQVTISMGRLQQVVRALSPSFQAAGVTRTHAETVLLLPAPGGQHTLGLVIVAEFFRREGWHVMGGPMPYGNEVLAGLVGETWVDVVGFSIGSTGQLVALAKTIQLARHVSRNRELGVLVGGPLLLHRPDLVARLGADMTATDAESAVRQASGLLAIRTAAD
jgi:methanogenic corrinoid protein MtbC1